MGSNGFQMGFKWLWRRGIWRIRAEKWVRFVVSSLCVVRYALCGARSWLFVVRCSFFVLRSSFFRSSLDGVPSLGAPFPLGSEGGCVAPFCVAACGVFCGEVFRAGGFWMLSSRMWARSDLRSLTLRERAGAKVDEEPDLPVRLLSRRDCIRSSWFMAR
jgi:hypothetical protein